jgi:hypothetical protein
MTLAKDLQTNKTNGNARMVPPATPTLIEQPSTKALTKDEKVALFTKLDKLQAKIEAEEGVIDGLRAQKSALAQEVYNSMGTGPFQWKGERLLVMKRGDTYFFRGEGRTEAESIG